MVLNHRNIPGARGSGQPLASRLLAAGKRTVVLASLLSGFVEALFRLTIRKARGKMADVSLIVEGSRVFFADEGPIYVCIGHVDGNFYFQDENGKKNVCFADNIV